MASIASLTGAALLLVIGANAQQRSNLRPARQLGTAPQSFLNPVTVDFDTAANGTLLPPGMYVSDEWIDYGMLLSVNGGLGGLPRLFDTANPRGPNNKGGDPDLGAPNTRCDSRGPGIGEGGWPGSVGENCNPLGNVLIIQEDKASPDSR